MGRRAKTVNPDAGQVVSITATLTFDALVDVIRQLPYEQKCRLLELLEEQVDQIEANWPLTPEAQAAIDQARREVEAGEYVTLDEFLAGRRSAE